MMPKFEKIHYTKIKVGDYVRITTRWRSGTFEISEGVVEQIDVNWQSDVEEWRGWQVFLAGVPHENVQKSARGIAESTVERRLPDIPTTPGSVVLVYDTAYLKERAVVRLHDSSCWVWADLVLQNVKDDYVENNYVKTLFDAASS
jgi:hypothetical protein